MHAYERALQANPNSTAAMNAIGMLLKGREAFDKALEFFRAIVQLEQNNGEAWGNLGMFCARLLPSPAVSCRPLFDPRVCCANSSLQATVTS